jgi:hypothetical protein
VTVILVAAAFVFYAVKTNLFSIHSGEEKVRIENTERLVTNNATDTIIETNDGIVAEWFVISNSTDTIIETNDGVVFAIPVHAFNSKSDIIHLEIKTALTPYDIMKQGLSTTSNGSLLKTAGMFYINGYEMINQSLW